MQNEVLIQVLKLCQFKISIRNAAIHPSLSDIGMTVFYRKSLFGYWSDSFVIMDLFFFFRYWNNNFAIVNLCSDFWNDMFAVINLCSYVGVMVIFIQILEWWLCIVARQRSLQKRPNLLHNVHSFNQWFLASFDACVLRYLWYLWPAFKF